MESHATAEVGFAECLAWLVGLTCVSLGIYTGLNHYPVSPPSTALMSSLDRRIPFLVWTIWPYAFLFLADFVLPFLIRDRQRFFDMIRAFWVAFACSVVTWMVFPTTYPRPPLPQGDNATEALYRLFVWVDPPNNCFPSGHVTIPAILVWSLGARYPKYLPFMWTAVALLSVTITTTHQHYVADLVGGFIVAFLGITASKAYAARTRGTA